MLHTGARAKLLNLVKSSHRSSFNNQRNIMSSFSLPSSMTGSPVASLCEPGMCQFPDNFLSVPLLEKTQVSPTSSVLRFGLPDKEKPLNLSTCACILANANIEGEDVTRPYTPISTNAQVGSFDLLIKDYGEHGKMSRFMCQTLQPGDLVNFKHIPFNVKTQAPFPDDNILMLVGGTGITPMIQALHAILGSDSKTPKVTMLYGSRNSGDILGKDLLDKWAEEHPEQFQLVHILSEEPEDSSWDGPRGHITKDMIAEHFPAPEVKNNRVFVCGPPIMYKIFCGPREEQDSVTGILGEMGYGVDQVYKF